MRFMITFNHVDGAWDELSPAEQEDHDKLLERFVAELEEKKSSELVFTFSIDEALEWADKGRWITGSNEVRQLYSTTGS